MLLSKPGEETAAGKGWVGSEEARTASTRELEVVATGWGARAGRAKSALDRSWGA